MTHTDPDRAQAIAQAAWRHMLNRHDLTEALKPDTIEPEPIEAAAKELARLRASRTQPTAAVQLVAETGR